MPARFYYRNNCCGTQICSKSDEDYFPLSGRSHALFDELMASAVLTKKACSLQQVQTLHMEQPNNPLHGKTLEMIVTALVDHFGWKELGQIIRINCFTSNPSVKSSLTFLRKTPWARKKVEDLYIDVIAGRSDQLNT